MTAGDATKTLQKIMSINLLSTAAASLSLNQGKVWHRVGSLSQVHRVACHLGVAVLYDLVVRDGLRLKQAAQKERDAQEPQRLKVPAQVENISKERRVVSIF